MTVPHEFPPAGRPPTAKDMERAIIETAAAAAEGVDPADFPAPPAAPTVTAGRQLTADEARAFLAEVEVTNADGLRQKVPLWQKEACAHCGGLHLRACPRVRRMEFAPGGSLAVVEFWKSGDWPEEQVVWPEQILDAVPPEAPEEG